MPPRTIQNPRRQRITGPWQSHPKRMLRHKAMIRVPVWPSDLLVSMTRMKPSACRKYRIHCRTSAGTRHHSGYDETMQEINTLLIALDKTWDATYCRSVPRYFAATFAHRQNDTGRSSESSWIPETESL